METPKGAAPSPVKAVRDIDTWTRLSLAVAAGGRCEFGGCNEFLLTHHVTSSQRNFSEAAHIVAFSEDGPRGSDPARAGLENVNAEENLMMLCFKCHKEIDDAPEAFSVADLRRQKREHEERIRHVTSLGPELALEVVQLIAAVGGRVPSIPQALIRDALLPRYPARLPGHVIDLSAFHREDAAYFAIARTEIDRAVNSLVGSSARTSGAGFGVFAIAPQPLLMYLGHRVSDLHNVTVFQPHREPVRSWGWEPASGTSSLQLTIEEPSHTGEQVAVAFGLSAEIKRPRVEAVLGPDVSLWTVAAANRHNDLVRTADDLRHFRETCRDLFARISARHPTADCLHVFPAMPASTAVEVGRVHMPKADLPLRIYDEQRDQGGFVYALTIP